jgi:hypothetical protein
MSPTCVLAAMMSEMGQTATSHDVCCDFRFAPKRTYLRL